MESTAIKTFDLDVLRGPQWITTYYVTGRIADAKASAKKALEIHPATAVSIIHKGIIVETVCRSK